MVYNRNNKSNHFGSLNIDNASVRSRRTELLLGCERKRKLKWKSIFKREEGSNKRKEILYGDEKIKGKDLVLN